MIAWGIQDIPQERSAHAHPTPRAGGVAIVLSFTGGIIFLFPLSPSLGLILGVAFLVVLVHFFDDLWEVSQYTRFLVQFLWASVLLFLGWRVQLTGLPLCPLTSLAEIILTLSGVVFTMNATNFIDGLNGLLSGTSIIATLAFIGIIHSFSDDQSQVLIESASIFIVAVAGFVIFNYPQAKIFMGDVGSVFIGLLISYAALETQKYFPHQTALGLFNRGFILVLFPFSFIWFDVAFTLLRRLYLHRPLLEAHRHYLFQILHRCHDNHLTVSGLYFLGTSILGFLSFACAKYAWNFTDCFLFYALIQLIFLATVMALGKKYRVSF